MRHTLQTGGDTLLTLVSRLPDPLGVLLTAVVLIAVVPTVVPAVTLQRLVDAQVVVTLEASRTSWPIREEDGVRETDLLEEPG